MRGLSFIIRASKFLAKKTSPNGTAFTSTGPLRSGRWTEGAKRNEKSAGHICACANHGSPGAGNLTYATTSRSDAWRGRSTGKQCSHQPEDDQGPGGVQRLHHSAQYD